MATAAAAAPLARTRGFGATKVNLSTAAAMNEAKKGFRRLKAYKQLPAHHWSRELGSGRTLELERGSGDYPPPVEAPLRPAVL